jgi:hypothetical protein
VGPLEGGATQDGTDAIAVAHRYWVVIAVAALDGARGVHKLGREAEPDNCRDESNKRYRWKAF